MDKEWIAYLRTLRGEFIQMGGKGSGFRGHKGRKGKRGGSAPRSGGAAAVRKEISGVSGELKPIVDLMSAHTEVSRLGEERKHLRSRERQLSRDAHKGTPRNREAARRNLAGTRERLSETESNIEKNSNIVKGLSSVKAPGYGEWASSGKTRDPLSRTNTYKHSEYGEVSVNKFEGAPFQKIAMSASVQFLPAGGEKASKKEWSGKGAHATADKFLKKHWGI